jgi:hypothetical protein
MRAPVELVEIAIQHPYHFLSYNFLSGTQRSKLQTGNWYAAAAEETQNPSYSFPAMARQLSDALIGKKE